MAAGGGERHSATGLGGAVGGCLSFISPATTTWEQPTRVVFEQDQPRCRRIGGRD